MEHEVWRSGVHGRIEDTLSLLTERIKENSCFLWIPVGGNLQVQGTKTEVLSSLTGADYEPTPDEHLHITLLYIPNCTDAEVDALLDYISPRFPAPFIVQGVSVGTFPEADTKPIILNINPTPALIRLQWDLYNAAVSLGIEVSEFSRPQVYKPHVTLAYDLQPPNAPIPTPDLPVDIPVESFVVGRKDYERSYTVFLPLTRGNEVLITSGIYGADVHRSDEPRDNGHRLAVTRDELMKMIRGEPLIIGRMRRAITLKDGPFEVVERGGPGSGHFDHAGRPGEVGGSLPSGESAQAAVSDGDGRPRAEGQAGPGAEGAERERLPEPESAEELTYEHKQQWKEDEYQKVLEMVEAGALPDIWTMDRDEFTLEFKSPEKFESELDYQRYQMRRAARRELWNIAMIQAVSLGKLTAEEAEEKGGFPESSNDWAELPPALYHVTTAYDAVRGDRLKSRAELRMDEGTGLGGGTDATISFTTDEATAQGIYFSILEAQRVARGENTVEDMINAAKAGESADRPFFKDLMSYWGVDSYTEGDPLPWAVDALIRKRDVKQVALHKSIEEMMEANGPGWEPVLEGPFEGSAIVGGDGAERYNRWERPMPIEDYIKANFDIYKTFSAFRENAGGWLDPLFFLTDHQALAAVGPEQIAILEFSGNGWGFQVSALGEWRTGSGLAVNFEDLIEPDEDERPRPKKGRAILRTTQADMESIKPAPISKQRFTVGASGPGIDPDPHRMARILLDNPHLILENTQIVIHAGEHKGIWMVVDSDMVWRERTSTRIPLKDLLDAIEEGTPVDLFNTDFRGGEPIKRRPPIFDDRNWLYHQIRRILADLVERFMPTRGGPGSGHFDHAGRPGEVGGSLPSGESAGYREGDYIITDIEAGEDLARIISVTEDGYRVEILSGPASGTTYEIGDPDIVEEATEDEIDLWTSDDPDALIDRAIDVFGLTDNPNEAGYILDSGELLDFSGKREGGTAGTRALDHRDIGRIIIGDHGGTEGMVWFMYKTGAIRMSLIDRDLHLDFAQPPTRKQRHAIEEWLPSLEAIIWDVTVYNEDQGDFRTVWNQIDSSVDFDRAEEILSDVRQIIYAERSLEEWKSLPYYIRHFGPGPHPGTGTQQEVHAGDRAVDDAGSMMDDPPDPTSMIDTDPLLESEAYKLIERWEQQQGDPKKENAFLLALDTGREEELSGGRISVSISASVLALWNSIGGRKVMSHTHPVDLPWSVSDFYSALKMGLLEERIVSRSHIYRMVLQPDRSDERTSQAVRAAHRMWLDVSGRAYDDTVLAITAGMTVEAANELTMKESMFEGWIDIWNEYPDVIRWIDRTPKQ